MALNGPLPIFGLLENISPFPESRKTALITALTEVLKGLKQRSTVVVFENWIVLVSLKKHKEPGKHRFKTSNVDIHVIDGAIGKSKSEVFLAHNIENDNPIAVKFQYEKDPAFEDDLIRERRNLERKGRLQSCFKVDAVQPIPGGQIQREVYFTAMDYIPGISFLNSIYDIDSAGAFVGKKPVDVISVLHDAIQVLSEIHTLWTKQNLLHRDIKTANFIIAKMSKKLELIDLDSAIDPAVDIDPQARGKSTEIGREDAATVGYMPPEYLVDTKDRPIWDRACDIWQGGMVIAERLSRFNYQKALVDFSLLASQKDKEQGKTFQSKHLSFDEIKKIMPDVFDNNEEEKKEKKEDKEDKESPTLLTQLMPKELIEKRVHTELIQLIATLTATKRDKRPTAEQLAQIILKLKKLYLEAQTKLSVIKSMRLAEKDGELKAKPPMLRSVTTAHIERPPIKRIEVKRVGGLKSPRIHKEAAQTSRVADDDILRKRAQSGAFSPQKRIKPAHQKEQTKSPEPSSEQSLVELVRHFEKLNIEDASQASQTFQVIARRRLLRLIDSLKLKPEYSPLELDQDNSLEGTLLSMYLTKMEAVAKEANDGKFNDEFDSLLRLTEGYNPKTEKGIEVSLLKIKSTLGEIAKLKTVKS